MSFTGKDRLHHTCSKIPSSTKQHNPEEKLLNLSNSIHYTPNLPLLHVVPVVL